ncbi:FlaR protein (FlaR) [Alishewanella sp. WH16-1]|uniref:UDP-2,4-diacetamido-2,4, 6-trideoxy-beta-L-altropyranose hydrolase n=1 Tax=Alishewanella sp. WH16-1 TaxID=1651088 RepID=UPI00070ADDAF|nr:UDP-2,4-diacetamido-2,4,6-trideoxy-beta-L-altropyranose hydrolase [Alishewanella sp. WH16-1]KRS22780.1 FlaR protein (FlaR) [Alishewanella sp. WH16-1]
MRVLFRVDASVTIGSGHIMRCLTLAKALLKHGAICHFACRNNKGHLLDLLQQAGFKTLSLPAELYCEEDDALATLGLITEPYQLLVIDHYQLGQRYGKLLRQRCQKIMVIDDLANRPLECDLLLDQNLLPDMDSRYRSLVPAGCQQLLGPRYALLREEFYQPHCQRVPNHLLVSFGGSDEQNLTSLAIAAIASLKSLPVTADIVIGLNNPWQASIKQQCARLSNVQLHIQTDAMAVLMQKAQLMIGAGGATHWERCVTGLPALVVTVAENQLATTRYLDKLGACVWLGSPADISKKIMAEKIEYYLQQPELLLSISKAATMIISNDAGTPLVVRQIINLGAEKT